MTSIIVDEAKRLALIHETGYWRVIIHPTVFDERRIPSLKACWDSAESASVRLRVWGYPHIDRDERICGDDWIQSGNTFANHVEHWRLYQSGQFVHQFALREDRKPPTLARWSRETTPKSTEPKRLDFLDTLYTVTEVLEFAGRLAYRDVLGLAVMVRIELHGMKGRLLAAPRNRPPLERYVSSLDMVCWEGKYFSAELIARAPQIAVDATIYIFEHLGWDNVPRRLLEAEQRRLLEHRL